MRRLLIGLTLGVLIGLGGAALYTSPLGPTFEQAVGLRWLFTLRGPIPPPPEVVVVAIDSRTGQQLDLPDLPREWPRSVHGELIDALVQRGASVIAFDVHFGRLRDPESDQAFVEAVRRAGNVVLVELLTGKRQPISDQSGRHVGVVWIEEALPPFPELADAAAAIASFPLPKEGASVHQFWVFKDSADQAATLPAAVLQLYAKGEAAPLADWLRAAAPDAALPLPAAGGSWANAAAVRDFMREARRSGAQAAQLRLSPGPDEATRAAAPLHAALRALYTGPGQRYINFYGAPGTVATVPYHAVVKGSDPNVPAEALDFTGKVVFVGYSDLFDPGQPDRFHTVFTRDDGVDLAGVEIAATAFANLLTDRSLHLPAGWTSVLVVLFFGLILGTLVYMLPGYVGVPLALSLVVGYGVAAQLLFSDSALVLPLATPMLAQAPLALLLGLLGQYRLERRRGQRISEAINYYLPEQIARDLVEDRLSEDKLNQVVYSTCLATDMAGFSTIAERLPPGELAKFLNDYFETLAAPLKRHKVHVTEFRADAIMCAWTAAEPSVEPRRQALLAALEAADAIQEFRDRHDIQGAQLRIGLEAGFVYVGHAGGGGRFVYSIVGDSANTASRVEGLNKHVRTQILATGNVVVGFENLVMRYLGDFVFVNKNEAVPIFEVLGKRETATERDLALCERFEEAIDRCRARDWAGAGDRFQAILDQFGDDGPAAFHLARCRRFMADPDAATEPLLVRMDAK
jgi:adenylate cyclase